jgi:hypothetical protein
MRAMDGTEKRGEGHMKHGLDWLLTLGLGGFCVATVFSSLGDAQQTTYPPAFPKYKVMGVVYAPPGSASFVNYGNSSLVGSTDTMSSTNSTTNGNSIQVSASGGLIGIFGLDASYDFSDT